MPITRGGIFIKTVEAGEMYGFKVINTFPDTCADEEWTDFADSMSKILKGTEVIKEVAVSA
jgi:hypothetical protein